MVKFFKYFIVFPINALAFIANLFNSPKNSGEVMNFLPDWLSADVPRLIIGLISLGVFIWLFWPLRPKSKTEGVTNNYYNCVINNPKNDQNQHTFILFNPSTAELKDENNIVSLTDTGSGLWSVTFLDEIDRDYFIEVQSDKNYSYHFHHKDKSGFAVKFDEEPTETIKLTVK